MSMKQLTWSSKAWPAGFFLLVSTLAPGIGRGAPTPRDIIDRAIENQLFSLEGAEMQLSMTLIDKQGNTRERLMFMRTMKINKLNRTITRFTAPPDVKDTSFLFIEKKGADDDQHMYMPALKVVRRIAGSQKNASFMGSEFSYADLESRDLEQAKYTQLPSEKIGRSECFVIDAIPDKKESYSKLRTWIRKKDHVFMRTQYFDLKGRLEKVLFVKAVKQVGKKKVPTQIKLTNLLNGHSTLLSATLIKVRLDLPESEFTVRALKKR